MFKPYLVFSEKIGVEFEFDIEYFAMRQFLIDNII